MHLDSERRSRVVRALSDAGIDALICCAASDVLLLTGYWPVMAMSVAAFTSDGEVHAIVPEDEYDLAKATSESVLHPYKPGSLNRLGDRLASLHGPLTEVGKTLGLSQAKIGIRKELTVQPQPYVVSAVFHHSLSGLIADVLPNAQVTGCDEMLERQKASRTPLELSRIARAARIAAQGFAVAEASIVTGSRENVIAAKIQSAFDCAGEGDEVERSYGSFYCMSGPNSATAAAAYARTCRRTVAAEDLVMIHANTCADGYWTDITRTYTAGAPPPRHQEMRSAIDEARSRALATIKPGVAARDVDRAARAVMTEKGFGDAFKHSTGHGVGYAAANGDALPRIHPLSPDILEEGMTFNIEPAAYFDGYGGMRHCDVVAVTADGCKVLTDF